MGLELEGDKIILGVELAETGPLIGEVSLIWRSVEARQGEVGWIFDPAYQGRGYATEAANAYVSKNTTIAILEPVVVIRPSYSPVQPIAAPSGSIELHPA